MNIKKVFIAFIILLFLPNLVFSQNFITEQNDGINNFDINEVLSTSTSFSDPNSTPIINARYGIVYDRNFKRIIYGKNENTKCKMASTTKIMTAIVVIENCENLKNIVTISKKSARDWWIKTWIIHK